METDLLSRIKLAGIVPVIRLEDPGKAVELGEALLSGGIAIAEVTFRTESAAESIAAMRKNLPDMIVGAGTVLSVAQAAAARDSGASFIVSPSFNDEVVDFCIAEGLPVLPGVNNPEGVERGIAKGLRVLKFFPAEVSGGIAMLDSLAGPYPQMRFVPTGGIDASNIGAYARRPNVWAIGGSWMVKQDAIAAGDWAAVAASACGAILALHGFSVRAMEGDIREKGSILSIGSNDVDRAVAYLAGKNIGIRPETIVSDRLGTKSVDLTAAWGEFMLRLTRNN